ncbi:hypothetical protein Y1Q_0015256 [Alligator mississippiensis]|uniref:Ig-like domain-containing protein n=1 Tax=Alligator mississippiensis TaxID=8496 RepID=A0A151NL94_ALLMI|nr:hypothetical protein Y1Q_0015256 [Alligator mississippiensis]
MWRCLLSVLLLWGPGVGSDKVEQPPFFTGVLGELPTLHCTLKDEAFPYMYWYRQRGSKELEALFYSATGSSVTNYTTEPMTAQRKENTWTLTLNSPSQTDSALYYCACSKAQ